MPDLITLSTYGTRAEIEGTEGCYVSVKRRDTVVPYGIRACEATVRKYEYSNWGGISGTKIQYEVPLDTAWYCT